MPPKDPTAAVIRNALELRGVENQLARQVAARFDDAAPEIVRLLIKWDLTAVRPGNRARRLRALERDLTAVLDSLYRDVNTLTVDTTVDIAQVQEVFATRQLERATVGAVGVDIGGRDLGRQFWRSVLAREPIQGSPLHEWWQTQKRGTQVAMRRQLRLGIVQQETIDQLVRRVRGRSAGGGQFVGGVLQTSTREAEAIVRTAVNQIATDAHFETYKAHDDVTEEYQYVATLDTRTTPICRSLDGRRWRYDDPNGRRPPQHVGCRSAIVPVVDFRDLGIPNPPMGRRAAVGGPVPANLTYAQWLRRQPKAVQVDALGPSRAALFRGNRATLDAMVRDTGRVVTLKELEAAI